LGTEAQDLPPGRDRRCKFDACACRLAFGIGCLGLDAQARRQVGFPEPE